MKAINRRRSPSKRSAKLDRDSSVFINCPFDDGFLPVFDAIVLATVSCGFMPRCAMESGDTSVSRMDRIAAAVQGSKYSIHDLSRSKGEGDLNLARFNMPLELGIAIGERFRGGAKSQAHDWTVLVPEGRVYPILVSDLAGYDPVDYAGTKESVVSAVMSWLVTRADAVVTTNPTEVLAVLPVFEKELAKLRKAWDSKLPWSKALELALITARKNKLVPDATVEALA